MRKWSAKAAAGVVLLALVGGGVGSAAERRPLDGLVAVVNDDAILASELGEEVSMRLYQLGPEAAKVKDLREFTAEVLQTMIDARLLIQDADDHDLVVSKEDVQPYVEEEMARIREAFDTPEEYEAALAQYGMTEKDLLLRYRKNLRDQLKIRRLTETVLAPRVTVTEEELRAYYEAHKNELAVPDVVTVREIALAKRPSPESEARLRRKLEEMRAAVLAGGDFASWAESLAQSEDGEFGRSFRYRPGEALPGLERAAAGLKVGQLSPVTLAPEGYWLVRLVGVENDRREVQYLRLPLVVTPADVAAARARAEAAAAAVAGGEPFAEVAARYSDNDETAARGGLVGELSVNEIAAGMPKVAVALAELEPGEVTPILEEPEGFFVLLLEERRAGRTVSYEEARDLVKRTLRTRKLALEQEKYLQELTAKSYIKTFE
jgi:peptidyl-prolyl cis-trans isomerase SurA